MRLEWIEDILAVAKAGSFVEAAERRHLTPSAFSRRLRQIEARIGAPLFDRSIKPARLRAPLADTVDRLEELANALRELEADLRSATPRSEGAVVATTPYLAMRYAARLHAGSGSALSLRVASRPDCVAMVLARRADFGLVHRLSGERDNIAPDVIATRDLRPDRLCPMAATSSFEEVQRDLANGRLNWIEYARDTFYRRIL